MDKNRVDRGSTPRWTIFIQMKNDIENQVGYEFNHPKKTIVTPKFLKNFFLKPMVFYTLVFSGGWNISEYLETRAQLDAGLNVEQIEDGAKYNKFRYGLTGSLIYYLGIPGRKTAYFFHDKKDYKKETTEGSKFI